MDLELVGEPNPIDREAVERTQPWLLEPQNAALLPAAIASAQVWLLRPRRGPEPVVRVIAPEGTSSAEEQLQPAWPLGLRETSEVVSPGTWTLVARLPGGREIAREVVLRAGETTRVRLAFDD